MIVISILYTPQSKPASQRAVQRQAGISFPFAYQSKRRRYANAKQTHSATKTKYTTSITYYMNIINIGIIILGYYLVFISNSTTTTNPLHSFSQPTQVRSTKMDTRHIKERPDCNTANNNNNKSIKWWHCEREIYFPHDSVHPKSPRPTRRRLHKTIFDYIFDMYSTDTGCTLKTGTLCIYVCT